MMEEGNIEKLSTLARSFHDQLTAISGLKRILRVIQGQDEYIHRFLCAVHCQGSRAAPRRIRNTTRLWKWSRTKTWKGWKR